MNSVLVMGGYGFFGKRVAEALAQDPTQRVLVGGRHLAKARSTTSDLGLPAACAIAIDANDPQLASRLAELGVQTIIHTAGPFQDQDYTVARAAIRARANYVDLADGRRFVSGIEKLNKEAIAAGVTVISGASSVPGLSSAVVAKYLPRFATLHSLELGISSGARAPGLATVKGIFGYLGKPFMRWRNGAWETTHGWLDLRRHEFPAPIGFRWMGSCDVPDLELFPKHHPTLRTVTFHAGFASAIGHLLLWSMALAVKHRLMRSASVFAGPLNHLSRWLEPLVSDKGGMFVRLRGLNQAGIPAACTWHVIATKNHGPYIPCGAAIALARKLSAQGSLPRGAMPCIGLLTVEEYLAPLGGLSVCVVPP